jgi:hypothetical protein
LFSTAVTARPYPWSMTDTAGSPSAAPAFNRVLEGVGRFIAAAVTMMIDHGPEVLAGLTEMQVNAEHARLLQTEWSNHPLLDFIKWQDFSVSQILAMTMPEDAISGHARLAQLLAPGCTAPATLTAIEQALEAPGLAGFAVAEFHDGLRCVREGRLDRAVTRLTIGLEGLLRSSAVSHSLLTAVEMRELKSGQEIVKRLWPNDSGYRAYMKSWVFGLSNPYRHGEDAGAAADQALHALCGSAIWASPVMNDDAPLAHIRDGLNREVTRQFAAAALDLQPTAEARVRRAAQLTDKSQTVDSLLDLRDQLLEIRRRRQLPALS